MVDRRRYNRITHHVFLSSGYSKSWASADRSPTCQHGAKIIIVQNVFYIVQTHLTIMLSPFGNNFTTQGGRYQKCVIIKSCLATDRDAYPSTKYSPPVMYDACLERSKRACPTISSGYHRTCSVMDRVDCMRKKSTLAKRRNGSDLAWKSRTALSICFVWSV